MDRAVVIGLVSMLGCGRFGFEQVARSEDGGRTDGTTTDTSVLGDTTLVDATPASLCPGLGVLMCDGFEQAALDPRWLVDNEQGSVTIDSTRGHRGSGSLHFHTDAITSAVFDPRATIRTGQGFSGGLTGLLYARVWAYFQSPLPTTDFNQLINFANAAGDGISFGARNTFVVNNDYTSVVYRQSTTVTLPIDRWACLQMTMPSGTIDTVRLYVDGQEVTDVAITKAMAQPAPTHIYLGLEWVATVSSQAAADAWFDEIIIDDSPTTCAD